MWANRVGSQNYQLLNSSFYVPLCGGDIVTTRASIHGLEVTDLLEAGDMTLSVTRIESQVPDKEIRSVSEAWQSHGASWSEGHSGDGTSLNTVWEPHLTPDEVFAFLVEDLRARPGWDTPCVYGPADRTRQSIEPWALLS